MRFQMTQGAASSVTDPIAFSVVIPCFNECDAISETVTGLISDTGPEVPFEIIVVDDGSSDGTTEILDKIEHETDCVRVVTHEVNRGYGAALKTGISIALSETIVITDADGTYPNHRIPELVEKAKGFDMLVGARIAEDVDYSKLRAVPKVFLKAWASWLAGRNIPDINSGLRVFKKQSVKHFFRVLPDTFSFTTTITLCMLTNYMAVKYEPISYKKRIGHSKIKPVRDTLRFCMLILRTGMYFSPVRLLLPFIVVLGALALGSAIYDIFYLRNLSDKTTLLTLFTFNTVMFALLADMIDKRSAR